MRFLCSPTKNLKDLQKSAQHTFDYDESIINILLINLQKGGKPSINNTMNQLNFIKL